MIFVLYKKTTPISKFCHERISKIFVFLAFATLVIFELLPLLWNILSLNPLLAVWHELLLPDGDNFF